MLRNYLDSPTNATPTFDGSLQTHCCSARVHCTTLAVAKLCLPTFLRQIALYSTGCRLSSRFVTINSTSIKPSVKVRNLTFYIFGESL